MKNKDICDKIKEVLSKEKDVIAIFNNGSSAVGLETPGSDVDFVVITKLKTEEQVLKLIGRIKKKIKFIEVERDGSSGRSGIFSINNRRVDLAIYYKGRMEYVVNHFYDSRETFLEYQHKIKHKIVDAVEVYDPKHLLKKFKKEVERYPQKIFDEVFKHSMELLKENYYYWKYHGFRSEFQFGFEKWDIIKEICEALYAKNKRLFMLPYKRLHKDLKELKPNIEKEVYFLVRGINTQKNIAKKIKVLKIIIAKLEK